MTQPYLCYYTLIKRIMMAVHTHWNQEYSVVLNITHFMSEWIETFLAGEQMVWFHLPGVGKQMADNSTCSKMKWCWVC